MIVKEEAAKDLPLSGRTVLVTRTQEGNAAERKKLERLGASVVELPAIKIAPPSSSEKLERAISTLGDFDWVVFTSANGVRSFFEACAKDDGATKLIAELRSGQRPKPMVAAIGPATRHEVERQGLSSSFEPDEFLTSNLARQLAARFGVKGSKVLLARAEGANKEMRDVLESAGATVREAPVYRTIPLRSGEVKSVNKTTVDSVTDITFTSPSTVEGTASSLGVGILQSAKVHCIGPVTARAAEARGFKVSSVAEIHSLDGLVEALVRCVEGERARLGIGTS